MNCAALLLAAGSGTRFSDDQPKVLAPLNGRRVVSWSLDALVASPAINHIVVMVSEDTMDAVADLVETLETDTILDIVLGGAERQETVFRGLEHLSGDEAPDWVLIHDAARPGVTASDFNRMAERIASLNSASGTGSVGLSAGLPAADTLVRRERTSAQLSVIDRDDVYRLQTPQAFSFPAILAAHEALEGTPFTCDATLFQAHGGTVSIMTLPRPDRLMKLTYADDLDALSAALDRRASSAGMEPRMGTGFDVHAFGEAPEDGALVLCGVELPGERRLKGHSDADVGLHTLTDAVYGALAEGDIGHHFPPSDPQWKGAASPLFLEHAVQRVADRGGRILHADLTLICEAPKIGPHRDAMRARVAEIMDLPLSRVSVKATTTEKLGFTGRGEGIAAQAVVTVLLPSDEV